jgi:hypothetical protein
MSSDWRPDDSLLDGHAKGGTKGSQRVRAALRKSGIRASRGITTSRDTGMAAARNALKRTGMPAGVEQWQLPIAHPLENLLVFYSRLKARTVVPKHSHDVWVFRLILEGSLKIDGKLLKVGDWALVPPGVPYTLVVGAQPCGIFYCHCKVAPPPPPPPPPPAH